MADITKDDSRKIESEEDIEYCSDCGGEMDMDYCSDCSMAKTEEEN